MSERIRGARVMNYTNGCILYYTLNSLFFSEQTDSANELAPVIVTYGCVAVMEI